MEQEKGKKEVCHERIDGFTLSLLFKQHFSFFSLFSVRLFYSLSPCPASPKNESLVKERLYSNNEKTKTTTIICKDNRERRSHKNQRRAHLVSSYMRHDIEERDDYYNEAYDHLTKLNASEEQD